ncbi:MAG: TetR family transcriptional regulator [Frankiales bacterium]|nr:TetR family transcriptional regulator [Frankiales bacterium]
MTSAAQARTRDPARKERILRAAAELIARDGFHPVSMAEIGAAAGVTGSAIYRHFDSKVAVLVALLDRAVDGLLADARRTVTETPDLRDALDLLVDSQVEFAVTERAVAQVYYREGHALPEQDGRRLRRNQRAYVEVWVRLLLDLRPGGDEDRARALVHAAIGAVQSTLFQSEGLRGDASRDVLRSAGRAVLDVALEGS